jgi:hypothetical protein
MAPGGLAITAVPVVAGLMANDTRAVCEGRQSGASVAPVRALRPGCWGCSATACSMRMAARMGRGCASGTRRRTS